MVFFKLLLQKLLPIDMQRPSSNSIPSKYNPLEIPGYPSEQKFAYNRKSTEVI